MGKELGQEEKDPVLENKEIAEKAIQKIEDGLKELRTLGGNLPAYQEVDKIEEIIKKLKWVIENE